MSAILPLLSGIKKHKQQEKAAKETRMMFIGMQAASQSGAVRSIGSGIGGAISGFGALLKIIQPFEPIIKVIGSLFGVLAGSVMKSLMPALKPIIKLLLKFAPILEIVGEILGWLIGTVLKGIVYVIYGIAKAIAWFVDLFSWMWGAPGSAGAAVDDFFAPVLGSFASGTSFIPQTGLYQLHQGESVNTAAETRLAQYKRDLTMSNIENGIMLLVQYKEEDR